MRVSIETLCPPVALVPLLRLLRHWEQARLDIELRIAIDAPELTVTEIQALLDTLEPPMPGLIVRARAR